MNLADLYLLQYEVYTEHASESLLDKSGIEKSLIPEINLKNLAKVIKLKEDQNKNSYQKKQYIACGGEEASKWIPFVPNEISSLKSFKGPQSMRPVINTVFGNNYTLSDDGHTFTWSSKTDIGSAKLGWGKVLSEYYDLIEREPVEPIPFTPPVTSLPRRKQPEFKEAFQTFEKKFDRPDENPPKSINGLTHKVMEGAFKDFENKLDVQRELANFFDMSNTITRETNEMLDILWQMLHKHVNAGKEHISSLKGLFNSMLYLSNQISNPMDITGTKGAVLFMTMNDLANQIDKTIGNVASEYAEEHKDKTGEKILVNIGSNAPLIAEMLLESLMDAPLQRRIVDSLRSHMKNPKMAIQLEDAASNYKEGVQWYKDHLRNVMSFAVEGKLLKSSEKRWISEMLEEFIEQLETKSMEIETGTLTLSTLLGNGFIKGIKIALWKIYMILVLITWLASLVYGVDQTTSKGIGTLSSMKDSSSVVGFGQVTENILSEEVLNSVKDITEVVSAMQDPEIEDVFSKQGQMNVSKAYKIVDKNANDLNRRREKLGKDIGETMRSQSEELKRMDREAQKLQNIVNSDLTSQEVMEDLTSMFEEVEGTSTGRSIASAAKRTVRNQIQILGFMQTVDQMMTRSISGYGEVPSTQALPSGDSPPESPVNTGLTKDMRTAKSGILNQAVEIFSDTEENFRNYRDNMDSIHKDLVKTFVSEDSLQDPAFRLFLKDFTGAVAAAFDTINDQDYIVTQHYTREITNIESQINFLEERKINVEDAKQTVSQSETKVGTNVANMEKSIQEHTEVAIKQNIAENTRRGMEALYVPRMGEVNETTEPALADYYNNAALREVGVDMLAYNISTPYSEGTNVSPLYMQDPVEAIRNMLTENFGSSIGTIVYHALAGPFWSYLSSNVTQMGREILSFSAQSGFESGWDAITIGLQGLIRSFAFHAGMRAFATTYRVVSIATRGITSFLMRDLGVRHDRSRLVVQKRMGRNVKNTPSEVGPVRKRWMSMMFDTLAWWSNGISTFIRGGDIKNLNEVGHSLNWGFTVLSWGHIFVAVSGVLRVLFDDPSVQGALALASIWRFTSNWSWSSIYTHVADNLIPVSWDAMKTFGTTGPIFLWLATKTRRKVLKKADEMVLSGQLHKILLGYSLSVAFFSPYLIVRKALWTLTGEEEKTAVARELQLNQVTRWSTLFVEIGAGAVDLITWLLVWQWALPEYVRRSSLRYHHDDARDAIGEMAEGDVFPLIKGRDPRFGEKAGLFHESNMMKKVDKLIQDLSVPVKSSGLLFKEEQAFPTETDYAEYAQLMKSRSAFRDKWVILLNKVTTAKIFTSEQLKDSRKLIGDLKGLLKSVAKKEFQKLLESQ